MIVPVMAISNLVLTQQIYSEETNSAHAHNRARIPWRYNRFERLQHIKKSGGVHPPPLYHGGGMNLHVRPRVNNKNGTIRKQLKKFCLQ